MKTTHDWKKLDMQVQSISQFHQGGCRPAGHPYKELRRLEKADISQRAHRLEAIANSYYPKTRKGLRLLDAGTARKDFDPQVVFILDPHSNFDYPIAHMLTRMAQLGDLTPLSVVLCEGANGVLDYDFEEMFGEDMYHYHLMDQDKRVQLTVPETYFLPQVYKVLKHVNVPVEFVDDPECQDAFHLHFDDYQKEKEEGIEDPVAKRRYTEALVQRVENAFIPAFDRHLDFGTSIVHICGMPEYATGLMQERVLQKGISYATFSPRETLGRTTEYMRQLLQRPIQEAQ